MTSRLAAALLGAALAALAAPVALAKPPPIHKHVLKNGLEVLVVESHAVPLVTVEIAFRNGSMTEPPDYNGLSHLYEHMFFKANKVLPSQEDWMARSRELGLDWNGTTNTERVNYFFTTSSDKLADTMVFMRDAILSPLFDAKELERERVVVTGEIDRNEASPFYYYWHTLTQKQFWKYPSRKDPLGNRKTVLSATPQKMRTIQQRYYVPNNAVLVITGDAKPEAVFAQAEQLYSGWKRAPDPFEKNPLVEHPPIRKSEVVLIEQPVQTVTIGLRWHGPSTVGKDVDLTYAADLLGFAIAEPSSKFQRELVDSGACVQAGLSWYTQANVGPISLDVTATPEKADECLKAVMAHLPKMREPGYLTDDEMKNAVHHAQVLDALDRERPSNLAHTVTFWWTSAGLDYYTGYVDNLAKVKQADIARYMDGFVVGKPFILGVMLSPELVKEKKLDKTHFELVAGVPGEPIKPGAAR